MSFWLKIRKARQERSCLEEGFRPLLFRDLLGIGLLTALHVIGQRLFISIAKLVKAHPFALEVDIKTGVRARWHPGDTIMEVADNSVWRRLQKFICLG